MRGKKKAVVPIKKAAPKPSVGVNEKLASIAVEAAKQAADSAEDAVEISKQALASNDNEEIRKALIKMTEAISKMSIAMDQKFTPIRVVPKRNQQGVAVHYDVLALKKKVH